MLNEKEINYEIQTLDDVIESRKWKDAYGIPQMVERIKARLAQRLPENQSFSLTALQRKALSNPDFWSNRNLIIQGATSSGKTLLAELLILDILQREQKAIVLVPLKAMVHERTQQFKKDIEHSNNIYQVFGSSSDYLDNDERLIAGEYNVAIVVYEKFFAMLNQPNCHILRDCRLIVVDELSMLSKDERGPKLEMAIEIARARSPESRIVCLATCDCKVTNIASWLKMSAELDSESINAAVIQSTLRPVGLDEYIVLPDGAYCFRHIKSEQECGGQEMDKLEVLDPGAKGVCGNLEVPGFRKANRERERKKCLLLPVLNQIYQKYPDGKVLIFVASQGSTVDIANELKEKASKLFPPSALDETFKQKLSSCDVDDEQKRLISDLLPRGIAYHNASLPTSLREIIEEEFQQPSSCIKLIVATETLTIGVNMPFDAMILMDTRVPRGIGEHKPLTNQEYRNYIGRAGRLGQSNRPGITYLFVQDLKERNGYWYGYYQNDREVESALIDASEAKHAPYYLGLLINQAGTVFDMAELENLHQNSLSEISSPKPMFSVKRMTDQMKSVNLMSIQKFMGNEKCFLLPFGERMAPYALSLDTCSRIYWYFFSGNEEGLPVGISQEDIDGDKYLLEILYHICRHNEIESSSTLIYPTKIELAYGAKRAVLKKLRELLEIENKNGTMAYSLWDSGSSDLYQILHSTNFPEEDIKLQATMRAILLFYWTQGKTVQEIQKLTGFKPYIKIVNGDLERMAEVASFHLDAIYRCLSSATNESGEFILKDERALKAFYTLQVRLKYGMPRALTQLANKHIHGLDRSRILAFGAEADRWGIPPIQLLYVISNHSITPYMTVTQHNQLLERLESRYHTSKFDTLMEIMKNDLGSEFLDVQTGALRAIFEPDVASAENFRGNLRALLDNKTFKNFNNLNADDLSKLIWTQVEPDRKYFVAVLTGNLPNELLTELSEFLQSKRGNGAGFVLFDSENTLKRFIECGGTYYLAMSWEFFALVLANALLLQDNGGQALAEFFADARGTFVANDYQDISLGDYIPHSNMEKVTQSLSAPRYHLLFNRSTRRTGSNAFTATELINAINADETLRNYEIMPWGESLENAEGLTVCPTVLFLERSQIMRSKSLLSFMRNMQYQHFHNCIVLFASPDSQSRWYDTEITPVTGELQWNMEFCQSNLQHACVTTLSEATDCIHDYLNGWQREGFWIGISYAGYDPNDQSECIEKTKCTLTSDLKLLKKLAESLRQKYGEHRILFDQFASSKEWFRGYNSQEKSLCAYRQCDLHIILWNQWSKTSDPCKKEREVIFQQCENGEANCIILRGTDPGFKDVCKEGTFAENLPEDQEELLETIDSMLHSVQKKKFSH